MFIRQKRSFIKKKIYSYNFGWYYVSLPNRTFYSQGRNRYENKNSEMVKWGAEGLENLSLLIFRSERWLESTDHRYFSWWNQFKRCTPKSHFIRNCLKVIKWGAEALDYLHTEKQIMHGDLKSANILVVGDFENIKVIVPTNKRLLKVQKGDIYNLYDCCYNWDLCTNLKKRIYKNMNNLRLSPICHLNLTVCFSSNIFILFFSFVISAWPFLWTVKGGWVTRTGCTSAQTPGPPWRSVIKKYCYWIYIYC